MKNKCNGDDERSHITVLLTPLQTGPFEVHVFTDLLHSTSLVEGVLLDTINPCWVLVGYGSFGTKFFAPLFSNFLDFSCLLSNLNGVTHFVGHFWIALITLKRFLS